MSKMQEITDAAALLARATKNENVEHRELLVAAEHIAGEIEATFWVAADEGEGHEAARIDDRVYTRVTHDLVGDGHAWLVNGRLILEDPGKRLAAEVRICNGEDPFEVVDEIRAGVSQVASAEQLKAFARDLPQILQSYYPRGRIVGEPPTVVIALRRAYRKAGVLWDWSAAEPDSHEGPGSP